METDSEQNAIEADFLKSWDWVEEYFKRLVSRWQALEPIQGLINELRQKGYDRKFRVGQSMYIFVLSRRREHGFPLGQSLRFELKAEGGMRIRYGEVGNSVTEFEVERVEITPEIEALLTQLLAQPID